MPDFGATRGVARAQIAETAGFRAIQTWLGTPYVFDLFNSAFGTTTDGKTWTTSGGSISASGGAITKTTTPTSPAIAHVEGGQGNGYLSFAYQVSGTPGTDVESVLYFRLPASPTFDNDGICTSVGAFTVTVRHITLGEDRLFVRRGTGGVFSLEAAVALPDSAANQGRVLEIYFNAGTVEVWVDGIRHVNLTNQNFGTTQTRVGVGFSESNASSTSPRIHDFFFTSVPSCPGAIDTDQHNGTLPYGEFAAGANVPIFTRWARVGTVTTAAPTDGGIALLLDNSDSGSGFVRQPGFSTNYGGSGFGAWGETDWFLTADGTAAGAPRSGAIKLRVFQRNSAATGWVIDSENAATSVGTSTHNYGRGYLAASTAVIAVAAPATNRAYGDILNASLTLAAPAYRNHNQINAFSFRRAGTAVHTSDATLSGSTVTMATADTVDNSYPAASTPINTQYAAAASAAAADPYFVFTVVPVGYEVPNVGVVRATDAAAFTVDPRIDSSTALFQVNDSVFGTPPLSKNRAAPRRLTADLAFLARRFVNARGEGINLLTYKRELRDRRNLIGDVAGGAIASTTTQGGEKGWASTFLVWDEQLPSGLWDHTVTITSPPEAVGLDLNNVAVYTLLAANPSVALVASGGPTEKAKHWSPGQDFQMGLTAVNAGTRRRVPLDVGSPKAALFRLADASLGAQAGFAQFLDSDMAWKSLSTNDIVIYLWPLVETRPGSNVYLKMFLGADTVTWGEFDLFVVGEAEIEAVPYTGVSKEPGVGMLNAHDAQAFDPTGLFA